MNKELPSYRGQLETIEKAEEAVKTLKMSLPEGTKLTIEPAV